jgi:hypothetical protein
MKNVMLKHNLRQVAASRDGFSFLGIIDMPTPKDPLTQSEHGPGGDDDCYRVQEPVAQRIMPDIVEKHLRAAEQKLDETAVETPQPPHWPMLGGVWTFPFYLSTLGPWIYISFGLMLTGWSLMAWIATAGFGMWSARFFGAPTIFFGVLTFGYAFFSCLAIMEQTSHDVDSVEIPEGLEWKEWTWEFAHLAALLLQAALFGLAVQLAIEPDAWSYLVCGTLVAFPLVLLGSLAADGAWTPLAIATVLRSFVPVGWAWGLFYLQTGALAGIWYLLVVAGLKRAPWLVPLYASPLLAAAILIYARLAGRLAGCIAAKVTNFSTEGDDDDEDF